MGAMLAWGNVTQATWFLRFQILDGRTPCPCGAHGCDSMGKEPSLPCALASRYLPHVLPFILSLVLLANGKVGEFLLFSQTSCSWPLGGCVLRHRPTPREPCLCPLTAPQYLGFNTAPHQKGDGTPLEITIKMGWESQPVDPQRLAPSTPNPRLLPQVQVPGVQAPVYLTTGPMVPLGGCELAQVLLYLSRGHEPRSLHCLPRARV